MPSVRITRKTRPVPKPLGSRMIIYTSNRSLPPFRAKYAPKEIEYGGYANTYNEVLRPDRKPILRRGGQSLRTLSMELFVGSENINKPVNDELKLLERMSETNVPLLIEYEPRTYGFWRITSLSYTSMERSEWNTGNGKYDDRISRAIVNIEFTEVVDPSAVSLNVITRQPRRPRSIRSKKGDTLAKIAKKYYGTSNIEVVKAIARYNKIKNLKRIPPGRKIKLP